MDLRASRSVSAARQQCVRRRALVPRCRRVGPVRRGLPVEAGVGMRAGAQCFFCVDSFAVTGVLQFLTEAASEVHGVVCGGERLRNSSKPALIARPLAECRRLSFESGARQHAGVLALGFGALAMLFRGHRVVRGR